MTDIKQIGQIPQLLIPAILVSLTMFSIYFHKNKDIFRRRATRLKEMLEYEALHGDSLLGRYKVARDTGYKLGRLNWPMGYRTFLLGNVGMAIVLGLLSFTFLSNPPLGFLTPILWLLFSHQLVDSLYRTRVKARIDAQAQLLLQLLAEIYSVSDNLPQAIERVIPSTPQPLRGDLEKLVLKINTNEDLNSCLIEFAVNIDNEDIETFVHGIILSEQFGTDAHEVIAKNAEIIRERLALREELVNETRGKRAIILLFMTMLPVMFLWLLISSGDTRNTFTDTVKGQYLVAILVLVEYISWYFNNKKGVAEEI